MIKEKLKKLGLLGIAAFVGAGYVSANEYPMFVAKGCQTSRITVGGFVAANYQWVDVDDDLDGPRFLIDDTIEVTAGTHEDPKPFNNFYLKNIRLYLSADLCDNWRALLSVDFAGKEDFRSRWCANNGTAGAQFVESSFECRDRLPLYIDRAYIEKKWCYSTLRFGYQKVNFGAEEVIPDEFVKTVNRSVATNFFVNLGRRAVFGEYIPGVRTTLFTNNHGFADRHAGIFLTGDYCNFHYSLAVVNGFQGLCRNSTNFNNELGYFAGVAYENNICDTDILIGINAGFKPLGANWSRDGVVITAECINTPVCVGNFANDDDDHALWAINPYILANWNCFSFLAEMLWGHVEHAKLTNLRSDAHPWGFNFIPSYMFNDCWEIVGRISYLNTNKMGTTIHQAFGAAPDHGTVQNRLQVGQCRAGDSFISSEVLFEKVTAGYIGINWYTACQAVKFTLGYECAKFKNAFFGLIKTDERFQGGDFNHQKVFVNAVRAQVQLMF